MRALRLFLLLATLVTLGLMRLPQIKRLARRYLHALMQTALRLRSRRLKLPFEREAPILVIAPHQDDGTLGCGGLILRLRLDGRFVHVAYLTDGRASHPDHPVLTPEKLVALRQQEARAALTFMGLDSDEITFLGAHDGTLDRLSGPEISALVEPLSALIRRLKPEIILLPCSRDGSSEHEAGFKIIKLAVAPFAVAPRLLEYPVWARWNPQLLWFPLLSSRRVWRFEFSGYESIKHQAMSQYRSQVEPTPPWTEPVLPPDFISFFSSSDEFYFET